MLGLIKVNAGKEGGGVGPIATGRIRRDQAWLCRRHRGRGAKTAEGAVARSFMERGMGLAVIVMSMIRVRMFGVG